MQLYRHQSSFAGGELSPELIGARADIERYDVALEVGENVIIGGTGAAIGRPGSRFVDEVADSAKLGRLRRFIFSREQAYMLEFSELKMRVFKEDGIVLDGGSPFELVTPWDDANLHKLWFEQSRDQLYVFSPDGFPRTITRNDHDDWTIGLFRPDDGPFLDENVDEAKTLQASAATGTVTLTATGWTFDALHDGALFKLSEQDLSAVKKWVGNVNVTAGDLVRANGHVYEAVDTKNSGPNAPAHVDGEETAGNDGTNDYVTWRYLHSGYGVVRITAVAAGGATATALVLQRLPASVVSAATDAWSEGAWSAFRRFPTLGVFFEQRLATAGVQGNPLQMDLSQSAAFDRFDTGDGAGADAISFTMPTVQQDGIAWMVAGASGLMLGTIAAEHIVRSSRDSEALTATNINRKETTEEGSAFFVPPVKIGEAILFVAGDGKRLVEMAFNPSANSELGFATADLDRISRHIARRGIVELAYQRNPWRVVWCRLADGGLAAMTYRQAERQVSWTRCPIGGAGFVEAIDVAPTTTSREDELWMIVRRTVNGATKRYVERLAPYFDFDLETTAENSFCVDSGLPFNLGAPASILTGLGHLEGHEVVAMGDGKVMGRATVQLGQAVFPVAASQGCVGLSYVPKIAPISPEFPLPDGPSVGRNRTVGQAKVHVHGMAGGRVAGRWQDIGADGRPLPAQESAADYLLPAGTTGSDPLPLASGAIATAKVGGDPSPRATICIWQPDPLPFHVTGVSFFVDMEDES